ncbi:peptide-N4-(N-acetyl-beta-glucosaminyl)asparagine amidase A [Eucalyptus grandis]|uniref:peptide-N4-(N-acetyl-beta- glucosaminyl)asparagine amidase A n=1 Tax=Eucalyptus grandis TaxID=71139 RepID=UPI00192E9E9E|nr:peptide-N4-(N-acetyl-beta-glucosaminyl)asparagine amidase A [Eucalyptus grandis]
MPPATTTAVLFLLLLAAAAAAFPDRFHKPASHSRSRSRSPQQYVELTRPLPYTLLPPACTHRIVTHSFADTLGSPPFTAPYSPPPPSSLCPSPPWSSVALELSASSRGDQYDRIAALWLGGVELLRTSTAEPNDDGVFWKVRKDVTRYSSLLSRSGIEVSMMLENIVNDEFTGIYHVNVTLLFYSSVGSGAGPRVPASQLSSISKLGLGSEELGGNSVNSATLGAAAWDYNPPPADLILSVSDDGDRGSWYWIERGLDLRSKKIIIPANTVRAVLELCVSFHGNDEFWYSNPPDSYLRENNLTTGRGNGAYREVLVMIDGTLVGSEVPFPVVFTGGINPLFWEPIVAIGAFILPSYDIELTPFLGTLLDCKPHEFAIGVANGISYWLVNANLHLWLDHGSKRVQAKSAAIAPTVHHVERESEFRQLDGSFKVKAKRKERFVGWVKSSAGNFTTIVSTGYKVKNSISFTGNGTYKLMKQKMKAKREVTTENEAGVPVARTFVKRSYPLRVITSTLPGSKKDTYVLVTNVSHSQLERWSYGDQSGSVRNSQDSRGWMEVKDHDVLSGTAETKQSYNYADEFICYLRRAEAADGKLVGDNSWFSRGCLS